MPPVAAAAALPRPPQHLPHRRRCWAAPLAVLAAALAAAGCRIGGERALPHARGSEAQVALGKALLAQYQCGSCHTIPAVPGARGKVGPPLAAFGHRSYIAGRLPNGPEQLARWIEAPAALVPDTTMPSMGVSNEDARAMAAYLLTLR